MSDGKKLEALVVYVEGVLIPKGFKVSTNRRVFEDGVQIAEFDIEVYGKLGTTEIRWLIECRDRPSDGPAPGAWIEQLAGRRQRFGFNKVTAVCTTGFTAGAVMFAKQAGIELRQVKDLAPGQFEWLAMTTIHCRVGHRTLRFLRLDIAEDADAQQKKAAEDFVGIARQASEPFLHAPNGMIVTAYDVLHSFLNIHPEIEGSLLAGAPVQQRYALNYPDDDQYTIQTSVGAIRIRRLIIEAEIRVEETYAPIASCEYVQTETGEVISQLAAAEIPAGSAGKLSLELHRIPESGFTHVLIRKVE